jgi:hypothetical protein
VDIPFPVALFIRRAPGTLRGIDNV